MRYWEWKVTFAGHWSSFNGMSCCRLCCNFVYSMLGTIKRCNEVDILDACSRVRYVLQPKVANDASGMKPVFVD
jgi:hypothetical protein